MAAEELAPLLEGRAEARPSAATVDESYVLPVLVRFDGSPIVSGDGSILYHFPDLQSTAAQVLLVWACVGGGATAFWAGGGDGPPHAAAARRDCPRP